MTSAVIDTSALVKYVLPEDYSDIVRRIVGQHRSSLTRTQFVIARSVATWQSRWEQGRRYGNEIATLRSQ